ncbi:OmpA family protein [Erythrobacter sp. JK5]|uniref:OmpA family protein n=1 Tax=Erythrobacter sp. JK5 TaxID=2829500 RepID=UPI001BA44763|nr:OmpA family protein [Erythrobacter sp. JK5]QUL36777.1 OmpA family protein [Erythrobacter sp. JK5]
MKFSVSILTVAIALGASSAASAQQADPERVAQMRCDLLDICGEVAAAEDEREPETIDGQESRSGLMGSADIRAARRATTAAVTSPTASRRVESANRSSRVTRARSIPATRTAGRGVTAAPAVEVTDEIKAKMSGRSQLLVTFATSSSKLTEAAKSEIASLVQVLQESQTAGKPLKLRIEGHASATGSDTINLPLSQARAAAVREALIEAGVNADQLLSEGYGSAQPLDDTKPTDRVNQRVEAVIVD